MDRFFFWEGGTTFLMTRRRTSSTEIISWFSKLPCHVLMGRPEVLCVWQDEGRGKGLNCRALFREERPGVYPG